MQDLDWDDLLSDIEEQNAVLLLGHGFQHTQEGLRDHLQDKLGEKLLHTYDRDGLFLFADSEAKTMAQKEAARYYRGLKNEDAQRKKIIEMPFPLIVSANPDKLLLDSFAKYQVPCQFDYFASSYKTKEYEVTRPSREKPLIYNLCGSQEDRESLLLDYDDLFQMLKVLLADLKIPNEVRLPLFKMTTYIFVGFHFERWYTQLFMRYLNMSENRFSNKSSNYVLKTQFRDDDMQQFFLRQFNVKYIGADWSFFDELHQRFSQKYPDQLRKLTDLLSPTATTIISLIEQSNMSAAFSVLDGFSGQLDEDDKVLLTMTKSEYSQYEELKADGTSTEENLRIMMARVRKNAIELAKKLS
ncbi:MAG: SIR2 family protein [Bacteroidia bacterium]